MIVVGVILYATLNENPLPENNLQIIPYFDKLVHAIMFGGLFASLSFDWYRAGGELTLRRKLAYAVVSVVVGALVEVCQDALDIHRSAELADFVADAIGVAVAYITAPPAIRQVVRRR